MTSSPDRRRRHAARGPGLPRSIRRWTVMGGALALAGGVSAAAWHALPERRDPAAARAETARSLALFQAGNFSAARAAATRATAADRSDGLAHAVLARTMLATGDGASAEAELVRARAAGVAIERTRAMMAEAWLLQGQPERALAEADRAPARFARYALRVRAAALVESGDVAGANSALAALLARHPRDGAGWVALARLRQTTGDVAGAQAAAAEAVRVAPVDPDALTLRAMVVRDQFGLVAALPWFEAALKRDPAHPDALIDYAATLGEAGRASDMLAVVRRVEAVRPGDPRALYLQAVLAARAARFDLARDLLQRAGDLSGVPGALLLGATLDLEAGVDEQAIGTLRALLDRQPYNLPARRLLGAALLRSGDARGALDALKPLALRPDADSYTLTLVGRAFEATGERDWAARFLDRAARPGGALETPFSADEALAVLRAPAEARPGDPDAVIPFARALIDAGRGEDALLALGRLARANPGAPGAAVLTGDALMLLGRPAEAAVAFTRAASLTFDERTALRLVEAQDRAGQRREAARTLALFLSQNPRNVAGLRLAGGWQLAAGEYDAAAATLEGLRARLGDRDPALLAALAEAHGGAGRVEEALGYAAAAYAMAPLNPAISGAYGWALRRAGQTTEARALLVKAVALAPRHPGLRRQLSVVERELGGAALAATGRPRRDS